MNAYDVIRDALCRAELIARATQLISQIEVPLANARKKLDELESARRISTELVTDEMAREVRLRAIELEIFDDSDWMERQSRAYLTAWQRELGPALGLTAWREPTDEVARKVFNAWIDARWRLNEGQDAKYGHAMINVVRAELGPALGLVEIREPTPEECERICTEYERLLMREGTCGGRDAFDAVRAVMWPKSEGS